MLMWQHFGHDFNGIVEQKNASLLNYIVFGHILFLNNCYASLFRTFSKQWLMKGFVFATEKLAWSLKTTFSRTLHPCYFIWFDVIHFAFFAWKFTFKSALVTFKIGKYLCILIKEMDLNEVLNIYVGLNLDSFSIFHTFGLKIIGWTSNIEATLTKSFISKNTRK